MVHITNEQTRDLETGLRSWTRNCVRDSKMWIHRDLGVIGRSPRPAVIFSLWCNLVVTMKYPRHNAISSPWCRKLIMFSSPKFAAAQNWCLFFWDQNLRIVSDTFSPISLTTTINKMKSLCTLFIQLRLRIFENSSSNIELLKREVIPVTRLRRAWPIGTFHSWSPNFSRSVMKIKIILPENYSQYHVVYIWNRNVFGFFHIQGLHIFANALSDCCRSIRLAWIIDFWFPCIWCSDLLYISDVPYYIVVIDIHSLFAFLTLSWVMTSPSVWWKSTHLAVDGLFVASQNFHSIMIVVPFHVSKSSRVLKS
jgi:hypothetical protein